MALQGVHGCGVDAVDSESFWGGTRTPSQGTGGLERKEASRLAADTRNGKPPVWRTLRFGDTLHDIPGISLPAWKIEILHMRPSPRSLANRSWWPALLAGLREETEWREWNCMRITLGGEVFPIPPAGKTIAHQRYQSITNALTVGKGARVGGWESPLNV